MKQRLFLLLCSVFVFSALGHGQSKTVTNADLEKYKERRVQSERGLREYYARQGITEEELAKREAANTKAREDLSARLRNSRLAAEQAQYEQYLREREAASSQINVVIAQPQGTAYPGYYYYGNRWYPRPHQGHFGRGVQWRATPMGVIYEPGSRPSSIWSAPTPPRSPAWRPGRRLQ